jgi:hypothetical protein
MPELATSSEPSESAFDPDDACPECENAIDAWVDRCRHCQTAVEFPNVRAAKRAGEVQALETRRQKAFDGVDVLTESRINAFEQRVATDSKALINRSIQSLANMLSSEDDVSNNFYSLVDAALRLPESDVWNKVRVVADDIAFPRFKENIRFAALALDDRGLVHYGGCAVVIKSSMIAARTSVMDENSLLWVNSQVAAGDLFSVVELPLGHRAPWSGRGKLAVTKLHSWLRADTSVDDASLLLRVGTSGAEDEFIEVHIWGPLTAAAIDSVALPPAADRRERLYKQVLIDRLDALGIAWQEAS